MGLFLSVSSIQPLRRVGASNLMKRMRYALTFLMLTALATVLATAQGPAGGQAPTTPPMSSDQANAAKARRIVEQGIQALGGQAYLTWRTQTSEGRSYELTKKRDVVEIFNGDKGNEVTYRGVRNLEDKTELQPYLRRHHYALDIVMREWLNAPGVAFFYEGQTVAAQRQTDQVTIMNAKNEAVTLNFDINSHLPVKKSFTWRDPEDRERNVEGEIYDNYRLIQEVMTPFDITRTYNGDMSAQLFLTAAAYNKDLDASMFDPQAAVGKRK